MGGESWVIISSEGGARRAEKRGEYRERRAEDTEEKRVAGQLRRQAKM